MTSLIRLSAAAALVLVGVAARLAADPIDPAVTYTSVSDLSDDRPFTLGYEFTLSQSETVNALGFWDNGDGYDHEVGIWDSQGNLLTSTDVLGSDPEVDGFQWDSISDYILAPGTYTIGGQAYEGGNSYDFAYDPSGLVSIPGYTWVGAEQLYGAGLNDPTNNDPGYGNNGIFDVDFSVTGGSSVPDGASTLVLLGGAIAMMGALRRKFSHA
jgi:hypothetical protein